jgi:hypothetical protein
VQPLEVSVVHENTSLVGPVLVAVGAIVASGLTAFLTVLFANRRLLAQLEGERELQRDQLDHARSLHQEQLDASRERFEAQLKSDREIKFREARRAFLDGVLERERAGKLALDSFLRAVETAESTPPDTDELTESSDQPAELLAKEAKAIDAFSGLFGDSVLLTVRLGFGALADSHEKVVKAIQIAQRSISLEEPLAARTHQHREATARAKEKADDLHTEFLLACQKWEQGDDS